jgi:hypothetical protein
MEWVLIPKRQLAPARVRNPYHLRRTQFRRSRLAGEALCLAMTMVDVPASSRASALLHWINTPITSGEHKSVGAGLLAKTLCLSITMSDVPASSRASALLHWINTPITCGKPHPWEPACWRSVVSGDDDVGYAGLFAGKRAPTWDQHPNHLRQTNFVGARLLAKALSLAMTMSDMPASSRASALLHWINTPITCGKPIPWEPACWRRRYIWR